MKLPFVVEPKAVETVAVGNEATGILNIPKLGDLSPVERRFLKQQNLIDIRREGIKLAAEIATKEGARLSDIYSALIQNDMTALSDYLGELIIFQDLVDEANDQKALALATAILRFRVMRDEDWTIEDTLNTDLLPPALVKEIVIFAHREETGWAEETAPPENPSDEELGNF